MTFVRKLTGFLPDLSRAEILRALPITLAYTLVLASLYLLKPARNALFLSHYGIDKLPYALLAVALAGSVAAASYGWVSRALRTDQLIRVTFGGLMLMLIGFRILLPLGWAWIYPAFFVWVALYGVLTTSLIWLLANAVFTPREARRVFGFIGAGGIAGAIGGGLFTEHVVTIVGTENLLLACVLFLAASLALLRLTPAAGDAADGHQVGPRRIRQTPAVGLDAALKLPLIRRLALMAGLVAAVAVIVDVQFNQMVDATFGEPDDKTAFFGRFFAYLSGISLLVQLFGTPRLLRSAGVGVSIILLPVAMGVGSAALWLAPGLMSATLAKGADGGLRHSVHKAASEVIFLPVPPATKKSAKLFLDTTVDASATGLGALVVVAMTAVGFTSGYVSLVAVALTIACLLLAPGLRAAYVDAFRRALEGRTIDRAALTTDLSEALVLKVVLPALASDNPRRVLYALDLLTTARSPEVAAAVRPLVEHPSPSVRHRALVILRAQADRDHRPLFEALLDDPEDAVRREATLGLIDLDDDGGAARLSAQLDAAQLELQSAALGCVARSERSASRALLTAERMERLDLASRATSPAARALRAELMTAAATHVDASGAAALLDRLSDEAPDVQREAIEAMGRSRHTRHIPYLVRKLADSGLRRAARNSLARYGDRIVGVVVAELNDDHHPRTQRQALCRVLEDVGTQAAADALTHQLYRVQGAVARTALRGLARLRTDKPDLLVNRDVIQRRLSEEIERYYDLTGILAVEGLRKEDGAAERLLRRAVDERRTAALDDVFLLLALYYRSDDFDVAREGLRSRQPTRSASALELLENVLRPPFKSLVLLMVDPPPGGLAAERFVKPLASRADVLEYLATGDDTWLKACAVNCVRGDDPDPSVALVHDAQLDPDPTVRETARAVIASIHRADGRR